MTTGELKEQNTRVLPVPLRPATPVPTPPPAENHMDRVWREIGDALQMRKAGIALDAVGLNDRKSDVTPPWQATIDFAKSVGLDLSAMSKQRAEETSELRAALAEKDQEVHEMRIRQLDEVLARVIDETKKMREQQQKATSERPAGFLDQLDKTLGEKLLTKLVSKALGDDNPPSQRTLSDVINEMADALGEEPAEIRKRLRGEPASLKDTLLAPAQDSTLRLQITKMLLDNEIEEAKAKRSAAIEQQRADSLGRLVDVFKDNLPDVIEAFKNQIGEWNHKGLAPNAQGQSQGQGQGLGQGQSQVSPRTNPAKQEQAALAFICGSCKEPFNVYRSLDHYTCPYCGESLDVAPTPGVGESKEPEHGVRGPSDSRSNGEISSGGRAA